MLNGSKPTGRVVIIGLDGVTFDLIEPWAAAGHLPNLARLMGAGAWGRLLSTIPAHSGPAWTTFSTGLQPGKHGVYFFLGPSRDENYFRPISADTIRGRRFWEVAGDEGKTVGIVNVPLTYPVRPVNGYMIAGLFAPLDASAFSSNELYEEIMAKAGGYVVEADKNQDRRLYYEGMMAGMKQRLSAAEYLMENHPTDLFVVVFRMIDSIMHNYWADLDPNHPLRPKLGETLMPDAILDAYRFLDEAVGRIVERAGSDATVMIMSDHGFRAEYKRLSANKWLGDQGYFNLKRGRRSAMSAASSVVKGLGLTKVVKRALRQVTGKSAWQPTLWANVDWTRTQVVYGPGPAFYLNVQGRDALGIVRPSEYEAIRDRIIEEFKKVRDPQTGLPVVAEVYKREEIYQGDAVEIAPDLIPEPAEYMTDGRRWGYGFDPFIGAKTDFTVVERYAGVHSAEGIFIAHGPHIQPGQYSNLQIADLAPTALYSLGVPVPYAMDGTVRTEIFDSSHTLTNPALYAHTDIFTDGKVGQVMASEDEKRVEARLQDLGYL